jgi:glycosyltransferase involved in cell wall biosynthesis
MKKIKICLIANLQSPHNLKLAESLSHNKNLEIYFITPYKNQYSDIKTYYIPFKPSSNLLLTLINHYKFVKKAKAIIKDIKPDVIHGQSLNFYGIWAYLTGFCPLVVTLWGSDVNNYEKYFWPEKILIKKTLKKANLILTNSLIGSGNKAIKIGADPKKIKLMQFGIDLNVFRSGKTSSLKEKLNLQNKKILFCPRSIQAIYNIDVLIRAFAKVAQKRKDLILAIFEPGNDIYGENIKKLIDNFKLKNQIVFLPKVDNKDMVQYYLLADLVVMLASSEGCSSSFMEAMAMEKKIVLTDLPFLEEWPGNYWKVPVRNTAVTSKKINDALKATDFTTLGRKNRELIRKNGEIVENFSRLENYYRQLVKNKV